MFPNCANFCVFFLCVALAVYSETTNESSSEYYGEKANWTAYMDFAAEALGKAKNSSVTLYDAAGKYGQKGALMSYLELADKMIKKAKMNSPISDNCNISLQPILDCSDLLPTGHKGSGVYTISPRKTLIERKVFDVYCDMETDGGGWTVIQRRGDFQNPIDYFFKDWKSYKEGFGDLEKEFWLGNDNIFALTNQEIYSARFDLVDDKDNTRYAHYDAFQIDDENSNYTLHISSYSGDAGDSMMDHDNQKFSTEDQDNDNQVGNCAKVYEGGWWYNACFQAHLNGANVKGMQGGIGKIWKAWKGLYESLARTEIKIRPKNLRC